MAAGYIINLLPITDIIPGHSTPTTKRLLTKFSSHSKHDNYKNNQSFRNKYFAFIAYLLAL